MVFCFASSSLLFGTWVAAIPGIKYQARIYRCQSWTFTLAFPFRCVNGRRTFYKTFWKIPVGKWMIAWLRFSRCYYDPSNKFGQSCYVLDLSVFFGMNGFLNGVSVNTTVGFLEKQFKRRMMSTCHGMYSLGGGVSAGLATVFFALSLSPRLQIVLVAATICIVIWFNRKYLLAHQRIIHSGSGLKFPSFPF